MGKFRNTLDLAKKSWHVLQKDRELVLLPVISVVISIAVIAVFGLAAWATVETTNTAAGSETTASPATYVLGLVGFFGVTIVGVFFTGALVAGAHERMTGGDPTVSSSISRAFARLPGLVPWALITGTVGLIFRLIESALRERGGIAGLIGRILLSGLQMAWGVASFLTIPAIVIDEAGPIEGFKRSVSMLRTTWGENLIAQAGFGILGFVLALVGGIPLLVIGAAVGLEFVGIGLAVLWIGAVMLVMTTLSAIFQTALYMYASRGVAPTGFEGSDLAGAIATR